MNCYFMGSFLMMKSGFRDLFELGSVLWRLVYLCVKINVLKEGNALLANYEDYYIIC